MPVLMILPATAVAAPSVSMKVENIPIPGLPGTGNYSGAGAELRLKYTISGSEYGGFPPPLIGLRLNLPHGYEIHPAGFASCPRTTLEPGGAGPSACPKGSAAGQHAHALAEVAFGKEIVPEELETAPFYAPKSELSLFLSGHSPVNIEQLVPARYLRPGGEGGLGPELTAQLPLVETVPGAQDMSFTRFEAQLGSARQTSTGVVPYTTLPKSEECSGSLHFTSELDFAGVGGLSPQTVGVGYDAPCPRVYVPPFVPEGGSGGAESSEFGYRVALSADGKTALIGAPYGPSGSKVGRAYIYVRSGSFWGQEAELPATGEIEGGRFGESVALSGDGNTAFVGAPGDNGNRGAVWVYARSGNTWTLQHELKAATCTKAENEAPGHPCERYFGESVAASDDGNTALIGLANDAFGAGSARVYVRSGSTWTQQAALTGAGEQGAARFGKAVALSADGNTALIGGPTDERLAGSQTGSAWAFTRSGSAWSAQGSKLAPPLAESGSEADGELGFSVALSSDGNLALMGEPFEGRTEGTAWLFGRSGGAWSTRQQLSDPARGSEAAYGASVSLSAGGDTALIGAPWEREGRVGAAWEFVDAHGAWSAIEALVAEASNTFGSGTALSGEGTTAVIGAPYTASRAGLTTFFFSPRPPEVGHCSNVGSGLGEETYENSSCTMERVGGLGAYEWEPTASSAFTTKLKEGSVVITGVNSSAPITCTGETGKGRYKGAKTASLLLTLTGCTMSAKACQSSGAASGEIRTPELAGEFGVITASIEGPLKDKIGLDLSLPSAFEFACGTQGVSLSGSVIVPVSADAMKSTQTLKFADKAGRQKPERFEAGEKDVLTLSVGKTSEQAGLAASLVLTNEEALEINSTV